MATDVERLVVQLSADIKGYENAMRRAQGVTTRSARQIETRFNTMSRNVTSRLAGGLSVFTKGLIGGIAAGFTVDMARRVIDGSTRISNALKSAGLRGEELNAVYEQLFASAQRNAQPLESLVGLYSKLALSQKELGVTQQQLVGFTDTISMALKAGGTSAEQASGALLQLSQAMGGGVVRAEEFNSILEGAPTIIQAAASGIEEAGGSVGKLRQLMIDGRVSSRAFFDGIQAGAPVIRDRLRGAEETISNSFVRMQNVLLDVGKKFNETTGAGRKFASAMKGVADTLEDIDLSGFIEEIAKAGSEFQKFLNQLQGASDWISSSDFATNLAEWLTGFELEPGKAVDLDVLQAGKEAKSLQAQIDELTKLIEERKEFGLDVSGAERDLASLVRQVQQAQLTISTATDSMSGQKYRTGTPGDPNALAQQSTLGAAVVKAISLDDYEIADDGKGADKVAKAAKKAADDLAEALARQAGVAVDAAELLLGQNENINRGTINSFLKAGGVDLDAATTAWCAAFVNSALAQVGIKGTGSNVATSFANWGVSVNPADIQRGDVLVESRGRAAGETGGHVGFATGEVKLLGAQIAQVEILSGNAADKVTKQWVDVADVAIRRSTDGFAVMAGSLEHLTVKTDEAVAAQQRLEDAQQRMAAQAEEINYAVESAIGGLIKDLIAGKDASEALANALASVADRLLDIALQNIFGSIGMGGGGGIGGVIAGFLSHKGGVVGSSGSVRHVNPAVFAGAQRMHSGGLAGLRPDEVPTILQRGEIVLPRGTKAGTGKQEMHVTVGVSADNNGNLLPFVESVSERQAGRVTQRGIIQYDRQLDRTIGGKVAQAQARQL